MFLINVHTMQLEEFMVNPPPYAILSHTWGAEEVTFADFNHDDPSVRERKRGWSKIAKTCELSAARELDYAWVDTCCIDKKSSAELSEAINSMYAWYARSEVCLVYLEDVLGGEREAYFKFGSAFSRSRWFRRGWTLQELVAPKAVDFYSGAWSLIGNRRSWSTDLMNITGILKDVLDGTRDALDYPVGVRLSWAADRETTRPEDMAYSLLGLLDINMPLLYGEGARAFIRLQEEFIRQHEDDTLFLWCTPPGTPEEPFALRGILAESPLDFANFLPYQYYSFRQIPCPNLPLTFISPTLAAHSNSTTHGIDSRGVWFTGEVVKDMKHDIKVVKVAATLLYLNCRLKNYRFGLYLTAISGNRYARVCPSMVFESYEDEVSVDNGLEETVSTCKTNGAVQKFLGLYRGSDFAAISDVPSAISQYGFLIRHSYHNFRLFAIFLWQEEKQMAEPLSLPRESSALATMFIPSGRGVNVVSMGFFTSIYFSLSFARESGCTNASRGAQPRTATHPLPGSKIVLVSSKAGLVTPDDMSRQHKIHMSAEMTFAQAEGADGKKPKTLVVTKTRGSRFLSLSVKLEREGLVNFWALDITEGLISRGEDSLMEEGPSEEKKSSE